MFSETRNKPSESQKSNSAWLRMARWERFGNIWFNKKVPHGSPWRSRQRSHEDSHPRSIQISNFFSHSFTWGSWGMCDIYIFIYIYITHYTLYFIHIHWHIPIHFHIHIHILVGGFIKIIFGRSTSFLAWTIQHLRNRQRRSALAWHFLVICRSGCYIPIPWWSPSTSARIYWSRIWLGYLAIFQSIPIGISYTYIAYIESLYCKVSTCFNRFQRSKIHVWLHLGVPEMGVPKIDSFIGDNEIKLMIDLGVPLWLRKPPYLCVFPH